MPRSMLTDSYRTVVLEIPMLRIPWKYMFGFWKSIEIYSSHVFLTLIFFNTVFLEILIKTIK